MRQAQDLLQCERCTVYILNKNIPPEEEEVKKLFQSNEIRAKKILSHQPDNFFPFLCSGVLIS